MLIRAALVVSLTVLAPKAMADIPSGFRFETQIESCTNTRSCVAEFAQVPIGRTFLVQNATCRVTATGTLPMTSFVMTSSQFVPSYYLTPVLIGSGGGVRYYTANNEMTAIVTTLRRPKIAVAFSDNIAAIGLTCTVTGQLKP